MFGVVNVNVKSESKECYLFQPQLAYVCAFVLVFYFNFFIYFFYF